MRAIERTLVILKPDAVQRGLMGEVLRRFERVGLKVVAMKLLHPDKELIERHYSVDPDWLRKVGEKALKGSRENGEAVSESDAKACGTRVLGMLKRFMTAGPVVPLVLEGVHAVPLVRKLVGGTEPLSSDVGTIRGDFVSDSYVLADAHNRSIRNLIHASTSPEEAEKEIAVWFAEAELCAYKTPLEHILHDVNFDNVPE